MQDVWGEKDKNEPADTTKRYDPQYFWDDYGEKFYKSHEKREMFQFGLHGNNPVAWLIFKLGTMKIDTVLEAGCGFGRLAPFILDSNAAKEYYGVDFSDPILKGSEDYLKDYIHKDHIHLQKSSAKHMPFDGKSMDCVISSELLMHMTRTKADHCLREFQRIAKKYVVMVERFVYPGEHPYPHIWSHNWVHLANNMGLTIIESKLVANGMMATICKV